MSETTKGTPKTLREAIKNGIKMAVFGRAGPFPVDVPAIEVEVSIERHVVDFLAQKFATHEPDHQSEFTQELWKAITGKGYGQ